jgi:hypothetical protein
VSPSPSRSPERSPDRAHDRSRALDALLRDLGPRLRRGGGPAAAPRRLATGLVDLDRLLGGGFARGRLSEVAGPVSSGRTSLALALLARVTRKGEVAAAIDAADAFDPASARAAGARLDRVLWVRPPGTREALKSAERLLETGGFALLLLDLARPDAEAGPRVAGSAWPRLARAAAAAETAVVVLSAGRQTGTAADLAVEMGPARPGFTGTPPLLEGLEVEAVLVRRRGGPAQQSVRVRLGPRAAA